MFVAIPHGEDLRHFEVGTWYDAVWSDSTSTRVHPRAGAALGEAKRESQFHNRVYGIRAVTFSQIDGAPYPALGNHVLSVIFNGEVYEAMDESTVEEDLLQAEEDYNEEND